MAYNLNVELPEGVEALVDAVIDCDCGRTASSTLITVTLDSESHESIHTQCSIHLHEEWDVAEEVTEYGGTYLADSSDAMDNEMSTRDWGLSDYPVVLCKVCADAKHSEWEEEQDEEEEEDDGDDDDVADRGVMRAIRDGQHIY